MELEICVDSVESAVAAEAGGAQRVELCSALVDGGITPSAGLIQAVRSRIKIGLWVMIRPRGGDFLYTEEEIEIMRRDIATAGECGADGVVLGVLTADGEVDLPRTRSLVQMAAPLHVTFHRAIDKSRDPRESITRIIDSGADRILTSGGMQTAQQGVDQIAEMVQFAEDRVRMMVCGGIRPGNVGEIIRKTGATEVHSGLRTRMESPVLFRKGSPVLSALPSEEYSRYVIRKEDVQSLYRAIKETKGKESGVE